ncbi:hypothetical protein ACFL6B_03230 [Thermodesulfobacteriota bacterium]
MIEKLKKYYEDNEISPLNFNCKYFSSCVSRAENKDKFTKGHGIWVGAEYEKGKVPKLLFLSLDSGSAELDPNKRTMEAAMKWNQAWLPGKGDKSKHWYRTHQFAWHMFNECNNAFNTSLPIGNVDNNYDFKPLNEIHKIKPYYAAANSAKCCMNNERRSQADSILFKNCSEHILGELAILEPDILVTQGKYARMVAEKMEIKKILHKKNISGASSKEDDYHILQMNNGKTLVWIHHYHPNNYGTFKKNRDKYITYANKTAEFLKNKRIETNTSFTAQTNDKPQSASQRLHETDLKVGGKVITQVKKLNVLEDWKYTREWLEKKYGDGFDKKDQISQALRSEMASITIRNYIDDSGPEIAPIQRHINRFIDLINQGLFDKCKNYQEKWNFIDRLESLPNNLLEDTEKDMDRMHAYNYQKTPAEIVKIIEFIDEKRREAKEVLDTLIEQLRNIAEQEEWE